MTLLNNFYHIEEGKCSSDAISCKVELNSEHPIYKAHFPNNPVTPGVCLVQMVTELLQEMTNMHLTLVSVKKIRYKNVVKPSDVLWFDISKTSCDNGFYKVIANINGADKNFVQMTLTYRNENR